MDALRSRAKTSKTDGPGGVGGVDGCTGAEEKEQVTWHRWGGSQAFQQRPLSVGGGSTPLEDIHRIRVLGCVSQFNI